MSLNEAIQKLLHDQQLVAIFVLVALDIVLGVAAAINPRTDAGGHFNFGKLSDFLRDDVLSKVLPWAALYIFSQMYTGLSVLGVDLSAIATAIWVVMLAALLNSLYGSLQDLGLPLPKVGGAVGNPVPPDPPVE
jgi:Bacteriophage holin family